MPKLSDAILKVGAEPVSKVMLNGVEIWSGESQTRTSTENSNMNNWPSGDNGIPTDRTVVDAQ